MWDRERIKTEFADTLGAEWPRGVRNPLLEYTSEEQEQMYWSFVIRSQIWQRGGLGYWSEADLSRIQWSSGKPPSDIDDAINKAVEQWRQEMEKSREEIMERFRQNDSRLRGGSAQQGPETDQAG